MFKRYFINTINYLFAGGGFSSYSSVPSWQADIVNNYLQSGVSLPNKKYFNASNRAYPDVSALGHNYIIQWGGTPIQVDGYFFYLFIYILFILAARC